MDMCRDKVNHNMVDSKSFKFKSRHANDTDNIGTVNIEITVRLIYLSNFWRTHKMISINCKITFNLTWSVNSIICEKDRETTVAITGTKRHILVVTLSTQDNTKLLQQLKPSFKRISYWNKY